jgi:ribosome maturation factor RimP
MSDSVHSGPVVSRVIALAQPVIDDLGLVLYDCELAGGTLTLTLDKPGGVLLDELSLATRLISRELDHDDPVPGRYTLEVSSPGLERRLRRPDHFAGAIGEAVAVRLTHVVDGARRISGTLVASSDEDATVRAEDGREIRIRYADIEKAKTVFTWGPAPKPGKGASPKRRHPASAGTGGAATTTVDPATIDDQSITDTEEAAS